MKAKPEYSSCHSSRHASSRPYKKTTVALLLLLSYICLTAGQVSAKLAGSVMQPSSTAETEGVGTTLKAGTEAADTEGAGTEGAGTEGTAEIEATTEGAGEAGRQAPELIEALTQSGLRAAHLGIAFALGTYVFFLLRGLLWIFLLRKLKLVLAYPLMSIGYVLVLGISFLFFNETLTVGKMAGALLLMTGVSLVSFGEVRQKKAADIASAAAEKAVDPQKAAKKAVEKAAKGEA